MSIIFKKSKKNISQVESDKNRLDAMAKELDEMMVKYEVFRGFGEVLSIKTDMPLTDNLNQLLDLRTEQIRELFLDTSQVINDLTEMDYIKLMIDYITRQKEAIESIHMSTGEMSSAIEDLAHQVHDSMTKTVDVINQSQESIDSITSTFGQIEEAHGKVASLKNEIERLVVDIHDISNISDLINDIAEETNLLALNASIESARAGQSGRGFAVIADGIKKLADSTKVSTRNIKNKIDNLTNEFSSVTMKIDETVNIFNESKEAINQSKASTDHMKTNLNDISASFENISANIEEESATTLDINERIKLLDYESKELTEVCMKTGQGVYNLSDKIIGNRNKAVSWYKNLSMEQSVDLQAIVHATLKWKVYNVLCGFAHVTEEDIQSHTECSVGKHYEIIKENGSGNQEFQKLYDVHKELHALAKDLVSNHKQYSQEEIDNKLAQLEGHTDYFKVYSKEFVMKGRR